MLRELEVVHTNTQLRAPEKEECILLWEVSEHSWSIHDGVFENASTALALAASLSL